MNINFIGFGAMAKAIARGLTKEPHYRLNAAAPSLAVGVNQDGVSTHYDNIELIHEAHIIILAVKPGRMEEVIDEIKAYNPSECLLISVAAGLSLDWFAKRWDSPHALVRTMPNTPASIGLSATPMVANQNVTQEQRHIAEAIFSTVGITHWVCDEAEMDAFTALSGSGPAYILAFVEAMINAATALGLDAEIAKKFALQTAVGTLKLAENSNLSLSELRTQVTSRGGTTEAALKVLNRHLDDLILTALSAAKARSHELGQCL